MGDFGLSSAMDAVNIKLIENVTLLADNITKSADEYNRDADTNGAMLFIVLTLVIYSIGITAFIAGHIYKRTENKLMDMQISDYLSSSVIAKLDQIKNMERLKRTSEKCQKFLYGNSEQSVEMSDSTGSLLPKSETSEEQTTTSTEGTAQADRQDENV